MSSISWAMPVASTWRDGHKTSSQPRAIAPGAVLFHSQDHGSAWRLVSGCLRLDRTVGSTQQLVQLALPGDWVGLEALCGEGYRLQAQALTPCIAEVLDPDSVHTWTWAKAWLQQQHRHVQMTPLRTGKVASRLVHLLELLALPHAVGNSHGATDPDTLRQQLPPLRVLAEVVDAQPETVCRALSKLLPHSPRSGTTPV